MSGDPEDTDSTPDADPPKDADSPGDADSPEDAESVGDADPPEDVNTDFPEDAESAEADVVFRAISAEHRRLALYYLRDRESTTIEELTTVVAGWLQAREDGTEVVTPTDRRRVQVQLHHVHLPKLDEVGFVRYDFGSGEIALDSLPALLDELLDSALAQERFAFGQETPTETDEEEEP